ncbi:MAG: rhomboid family intramembrane serine protease [Prevotella sp.]
MRNIPTVTKNLLLVNIIAFVATWMLQLRGIDLNDICGLHFFMAADFHLWQLVTYMFLHSGFMHILFNMFALWMFGVVIENVWGPRKFLFYYISCGVGAGLMQELAQFCSFYLTISAQDPSVTMSELFVIGQQLSMQLNGWTTIGASGAVYAILLAFGMIFPNERIFIFPLPIPIKAKWFVMFYVAIELFSALGSSGDNVAHMAHLGGMLFGFLMIRYWNNHPTAGYGRNRGHQFFDNLKENFERRRGAKMNVHKNGSATREDDWSYNEKKKQNQEEIDRILDKIRRSGYDSLTKEEKQKLFDSSNER